jgi:hypothetical protein
MKSTLVTTKNNKRSILSYQAKRNQITRVARGVYSSDNSYDMLEVISLRYSEAIFTLETMFSIFGMTDRFIDKYWIVMPRGSRTIQDERIIQMRQQDSIINIGISTFQHNGYSIRTYDKERLLIELFRFRNRISKPLYQEVVKHYRKVVYQAFDFHKFHEYCGFFREKDLLEEKFAKEIL